MPLKMAAVFLDASVETLRSLCWHCTLYVSRGTSAVAFRGFSSGSPVCCDALGKTRPSTQPAVYSPGVWGLDSPRANSRRWWRLRGFPWHPTQCWRCDRWHKCL